MARGYLLDNRSVHSQDRFGALSALFDPVTFRHLAAVGVGAGWRCWEVGAGGPSVPAWLAERAGAEVVASDVDVRWLGAPMSFEVLEHDVVTDPPPGEFDLIHARLVLTHLARRVEVLATLAGALRPGGWLVIEDFDMAMQLLAVVDASTPAEHRANRVRAGFATLLRERGVDPRLGRSLPRQFRALGLEDVGADAFLPLAVDAVAELERANVEQVRDGLVRLGVVTDAELDAHVAALDELDLATPPLVSAWGRRRAD